jgi:hypothetical protein
MGSPKIKVDAEGVLRHIINDYDPNFPPEEK